MDLQAAVKLLGISGKKEQEQFYQELLALYQDERTYPFVFPESIPELHQLYNVLLADLNPLELMLRNAQANQLELLPYLQEIIQASNDLPDHPQSVFLFLHLAARKLDQEEVIQLLSSGLFKVYKLDRLQLLPQMYTINIKVLIAHFQAFGQSYPKDEQLLLFDLLELLYPSSLDEESPAHIHQFFKEALPAFIRRLESQMTRAELFQHPIKIAQWYLVWQRHQSQAEPAIDSPNAYYDMAFNTIIQYVPEYLWWNNGLFFQNGEKVFAYGSPAFAHLAIGGSLRKTPDVHQFTRRMAKEFLKLPFDFDQTGRDMYLYLYFKSLGAGEQLCMRLQQFIPHPTKEAELLRHLEQWNPIIQKLASPSFEALHPQEAQQLLGYLHHMLEEDSDFSVKEKTFNRIIHDSEAYYLAIEQRAQERADRRTEHIVNLIRQQMHARVQALLPQLNREEIPNRIALFLDDVQLRLGDQVTNQLQREFIMEFYHNNQPLVINRRMNIAINNRRRRLREREEQEEAQQARLRYQQLTWPSHPSIEPFKREDYRIIELCSSSALSSEGRIMGHCVGGYGDRCAYYQHSIWSLRKKQYKNTHSCVTIEVDPNGTIVQARARFNSTPTSEHRSIIDQWIKRNKDLKWGAG